MSGDKVHDSTIRPVIKVFTYRNHIMSCFEVTKREMEQIVTERGNVHIILNQEAKSTTMAVYFIIHFKYIKLCHVNC